MHARHRRLMDRESNAACQGAYRSIFGPVKTSQLVSRVSLAYGEPTGHSRVNQVPLEREGEGRVGERGGVVWGRVHGTSCNMRSKKFSASVCRAATFISCYGCEENLKLAPLLPLVCSAHATAASNLMG